MLGALFAGSLLAVAVAIGLSPLALLGPVRPVYPDPGVAFDWTVLGLGLLALIVVLGSLAVILARREVSRVTSQRPSEAWKREPRWVSSAATSGLPISAVTGLRFALDPGRGRDATPVRSAVLGAVLAVVVLVTTVTFGASLDNLVSHPALYGWNWNYALLSGFAGQEDLPGHQIATLLNQDPEIKSERTHADRSCTTSDCLAREVGKRSWRSTAVPECHPCAATAHSSLTRPRLALRSPGA